MVTPLQSSLPTEQAIQYERLAIRRSQRMGATSALITVTTGRELRPEFLASLATANLLEIIALCGRAQGEDRFADLRQQCIATLLARSLGSDDAYGLLRLVAPSRGPIIIPGHDDGEIPSDRGVDATRESVYRQLGLDTAACAAWERLLCGPPAESEHVTITTLIEVTRPWIQGVALLLSQVPSSTSGYAGLVLKEVAKATDGHRRLLLLYDLQPWANSAPVLEFAATVAKSDAELADIIAVAGRSSTAAIAVAQNWSRVDKMLP